MKYGGCMYKYLSAKKKGFDKTERLLMQMRNLSLNAY